MRGSPSRRFSTLTPHQICGAAAACVQTGLEQFPHSSRSFGQDLVGVPVRLEHDIDDFLDVLIGYIFVKEVTHRVDEYHPRPGPLERIGKFFRNEPQIETLFIRMARNTAEPLGKCLGVAVGTARTDLRATPDWVPGRVSPFDASVVAHAAVSNGKLAICPRHACGV